MHRVFKRDAKATGGSSHKSYGISAEAQTLDPIPNKNSFPDERIEFFATSSRLHLYPSGGLIELANVFGDSPWPLAESSPMEPQALIDKIRSGAGST